MLKGSWCRKNGPFNGRFYAKCFKNEVKKNQKLFDVAESFIYSFFFALLCVKKTTELTSYSENSFKLAYSGVLKNVYKISS